LGRLNLEEFTEKTLLNPNFAWLIYSGVATIMLFSLYQMWITPLRNKSVEKI